MNISQYYYVGNNQNLVTGVSFLSLTGSTLYTFGLPIVGFTMWALLGYFLYAAIIFLFVWIAVFSLKTYFKLLGHKRVITINDKSITFPELGDSLTVIELKFSEITEVYFAEGRHRIPDNLIIKYGCDGHAYIAKSYLKPQDFEAICGLLKEALKIKTINIK